MLGEGWPIVGDLLGIGAQPLAVWQMALRALVVYLAAIILVRLGEKRFLGHYGALDVILGFMLGSVLSRAITGSSPFFETVLGGGLALVLVHWLFAVLSFHSARFDTLVKGHQRVLVRNGQIQWEGMRKGHITETDLHAALRSGTQADDLDKVQVARLERSGHVSFVTQKQEPRVIEVAVQDGVQVVRLQIE